MVQINAPSSQNAVFTPENFTVLWLEAPAELPEEDKRQERKCCGEKMT